ncbi:hypothetical protein AAFN60_06625 [Roseibacillus persicicus]|uniref:hypothetical protein n=1 Tax=Roseibacillus persicicus TaxID=454148 RepID=UPI00398B782A
MNDPLKSGKHFFRRWLASLAIFTIVLAPLLQAGSRQPSPVSQDIRRHPGELTPKVQDDDYSCGFLALSAIYESYGLDPVEYRLRERLGTSVPAIPFVESSTGTLQADLFRVLQQDGFNATPINPKDPVGYRQLTRHLEGGYLSSHGDQYALALISTEQVGGLHWIAFTHFDPESEEVTIGDSLITGLHSKSLPSMVEDNLLRVILLEPALADPYGSYGIAHLRGIGEMALSLPPLLLVIVLLVLIGLVVAGSYLTRKLFRSLRLRFKSSKS